VQEFCQKVDVAGELQSQENCLQRDENTKLNHDDTTGTTQKNTTERRKFRCARRVVVVYLLLADLPKTTLQFSWSMGGGLDIRPRIEYTLDC